MKLYLLYYYLIDYIRYTYPFLSYCDFLKKKNVHCLVYKIYLDKNLLTKVNFSDSFKL